MTAPEHIEPHMRASHPERSAWVSAHAGSGKTFTLIDRLTRLLLAGVDPQRILCLTFTKAAAAEMAERLHLRLGAWAICTDAKLAKDITKLEGAAPDAEKLGRAKGLFAAMLSGESRLRIQTIHAFCQSVLKRFPIEADISPAFRVIDDYATKAILKEAHMHMLNHAKKDSTAIETIAHHMDSTGFEKIFQDITAHINDVGTALENYPDKLRAIARGWNLSDDDEQKLLSEIIQGRNVNAMRAAAEDLIRDGKSRAHGYGEKLLKNLDIISKDDALSFIDDYIRVFLTQTGEIRKTIIDKNCAKQNPKSEKILMREQARVFSLSQRANAAQSLALTAAIADLAHIFLNTFANLKRRQGVLDYDDLINKTLALFSEREAAQWVLYRLDGGLDHILIDEAQDTNPAQWELISYLTEEFFAGLGYKDKHATSLFAVGDAKQSIFGFQGAAPDGFDKWCRYFEEKAKAADKDFEPISLTRSFRAAPKPLALIDNVFKNNKNLPLGTADQEQLHHIANRKKAKGHVELWACMTDAKDRPPAEQPRAEQRLAETIATKIAALIHEEKKSAKNILILLRRRNQFVNSLIAALNRRGLPVAGADRLKLGENLAVMDLISLAKFALLPEDDLSLAEVLKSPIGNLSEAELMSLALDRTGSLWEALTQRRDAFPKIYHLLAQCLNRADFVSIFEFFSEILEIENIRGHFVKLMGEEAHDPLDEFLNLTLLYEQSNTPSLQGFVEWFARAEAEIKRDMERARDEIRIMTIHGAKGLEADIVFLADIPPAHLPTSWLPLETDFGKAPFWRKANISPLEIENINAAQKQHQQEEEHRLLYVALTRAKDQLYICGYRNRGGSALLEEIEKHLEPTPPPEIKKSRHPPQSTKPKPAPDWVRDQPPQTKTKREYLNPSTLFHPQRRAIASPLAERAEGEAALLGTIMHEALRYAAQSDIAQLTLMLKNKFAHNPHCAEIARQASALIKNEALAPLFRQGRAEVPLQALIGAEKQIVLSGQIDRLILNEAGKTADIIDYKTDAAPPTDPAQMPDAYQRQCAAYRLMLREVYPDWRIRAAILWTRIQRLDWLDENMLDRSEKMIISHINKGETS